MLTLVNLGEQYYKTVYTKIISSILNYLKIRQIKDHWEETPGGRPVRNYPPIVF